MVCYNLWRTDLMILVHIMKALSYIYLEYDY